MSSKHSATWAVAGIGLSLLFAPAVRGQDTEHGFVRITPDQVQWRDLPGYAGMQGAVLDGDPRRPGVYVIRVKFPPGVMTRPHFHPEDRYVLVISGTWWVGAGDSFEPEKTVPLTAGSFLKQPAGSHHFDGAKDEEVVLQIVGVGPSGTTFIRPQDGPIGSSGAGH